MPPREWQLRIEDMSEAVSRIQQYVSGMTFEEFRADAKTVDAVIRNFSVIGEAARNIPDDVQKRYPDLPWVEMRRMRNLVVHQYFGVDFEVLWGTVQADLPPLVPKLQNILIREK